jgi:hypothetical protein
MLILELLARDQCQAGLYRHVPAWGRARRDRRRDHGAKNRGDARHRTGGMGSIEGALIGALIVGLCRAAAVHLLPQLDLFVIYAVMALVLVFRPYGLIARAQPRRI